MKAKIVNLLKSSITAPTIFWGLSMVANVFNWLFNIKASRILTKEEFAVLTVFLSIQFLISVPTNALSITISRFVAYYSGKGEQHKHFYFLRQYWWLSWTAGIGLMLFILLLNEPLRAFFGLESSFLILVFAPLVIPSFLFAFEKGTLSGQLAFVWVGVLFVIEAVIKFIFLVLSPYLPINLLTVAVLSLPISVSLAWFFSTLITRSFHPLPIQAREEGKKDVSDSYEFLWNSIFASLGIVLIFNIDILLVKHFFPAFSAGVYSTLALLGKILYFGAGGLISLLIPLTARAQAKNRSDRMPFLILLSVIAVAGTFVWLLYLLVPEFIVTLILTQQSLEVVPYLATYTLGMLFLALSACFTSYNLAKKNYFPVRLTILGAIVQGILIIFFHNSLAQVVKIVMLTMFGLLATLTVVEVFSLNTQAILNNVISFLKLFQKDLSFTENKQRKIKVLIFSWRDIKHVNSGGAEVYIQEISRRLSKSRYEVTLFTANDGLCLPYEKINGINIIRRGGFFTVYIWAAVYYLTKFRKNFDLVVDIENGVPFFSPLYSRKPVILLVHHVHQDVFFKTLIPPFSWLANWLEAYLMPFAYQKSTVVAVSNSTARELLDEIGLVTSSVICNGLDIKAYGRSEKSPVPLISYVGRLKEYKSIEVLLMAFKELLRDVPNAKLVIAGEGDHLEVLEKEAQKLDISESVTFPGRISEQAKVSLLGRSWAMVQPSYMEGWGITCLEANACATPVVASRVGGLKDVVLEGKSGYLFEYGDYMDLSLKLKELITDHKTRAAVSETSKAWSQQYSWAKQARKFDHLIKEILTPKPMATNFEGSI